MRRQRARRGYCRLVAYPSSLAYSRLEREAKKRRMTAAIKHKPRILRDMTAR